MQVSSARAFLERTFNGAMTHEQVLEERIKTLHQEIERCEYLLSQLRRTKESVR